MQARLLILNNAKRFLLSSDDAMNKIIFLFENENPQDYLNKKSIAEQKEIINAANALRTNLLVALNQEKYPSSKYTALYDALLLLACCFPLNEVAENKKIKCSLSNDYLDEKNCFVLASGHWFSKKAIGDFYINYLKHPIENETLTAQDISRIKALTPPESQSDKLNHLFLPMQDDSWLRFLIAGGGLLGFLAGITGIIMTISSLGLFLLAVGPLMLGAGLLGGLLIGGALFVAGDILFMLGASLYYAGVCMYDYVMEKKWSSANNTELEKGCAMSTIAS